MKVSQFISALAWVSVVMLPWAVVLGWLPYSGLALGSWIFFIIVGIGSGLLSWSGGRIE